MGKIREKPSRLRSRGSVYSGRAPGDTGPLSTEFTELPTRQFLLDYCQKYWSQWTAEVKSELERLGDEKKTSRSAQSDTLMNVELLYARLTQVEDILLMDHQFLVFRVRWHLSARKLNLLLICCLCSVDVM